MWSFRPNAPRALLGRLSFAARASGREIREVGGRGGRGSPSVSNSIIVDLWARRERAPKQLEQRATSVLSGGGGATCSRLVH